MEGWNPAVFGRVRIPLAANFMEFDSMTNDRYIDEISPIIAKKFQNFCLSAIGGIYRIDIHRHEISTDISNLGYNSGILVSRKI